MTDGYETHMGDEKLAASADAEQFDGGIGEEELPEASDVTDPTEDGRGGTEGGAPEFNGAADIPELCLEFPELRAGDVSLAVNAERYRELRAIGLTPREAYLATAKASHADNRSHLVTGVPSGAKIHSVGMTSWEMSTAKGLFSDLSESEIKRLYNRVTSQRQ